MRLRLSRVGPTNLYERNFRKEKSPQSLDLIARATFEGKGYSLFLSFSLSLFLSFSCSLVLSFSRSLVLSFSLSLFLLFSRSLVLFFSLSQIIFFFLNFSLYLFYSFPLYQLLLLFLLFFVPAYLYQSCSIT